MNKITQKLNVDDLILQALREDIPGEDVSTNAVVPEARPGTVDLIAKEDGIVAGLEVFARVFTLLDDQTQVEFLCEDGEKIRKGQKLAVVTGDIRVLLSGGTGSSELSPAHERNCDLYASDGLSAGRNRNYAARYAQDESE